MRELREDKGLRQEDIAALFGFGKSTVSQWENGKSQPEYEILLKLANYFGVTTDYLLGLTDEPRPTNINATPSELAREIESLPPKDREIMRRMLEALKATKEDAAAREG